MSKQFEVTLTKNGWHRKIQTYVFPSSPEFQSLCPYFWLTVFSFIVTFVVPIVPVVKVVKWILSKIGNFILFPVLKFITNKICLPILEAMALNMDEEELTDAFAASSCKNNELWGNLTTKERELVNFFHVANDYYSLSSKSATKLETKLNTFMQKNPDWREKINAAMEKVKADIEVRKKQKHLAYLEDAKKKAAIWKQKQVKTVERKVRAKKAQSIFTLIALYTKYPFYLLVGLFVGLVISVLYGLVGWLISSVPWSSVLNTLVSMGIILLVASIAAAVVVLIVFLTRKCVIGLSDFISPKTKRKLKAFGDKFSNGIVIFVGNFISFFKFIGSIFKGLWNGIMFVVEFFKATKDDYCPAINWEETEQEKSKMVKTDETNFPD